MAYKRRVRHNAAIRAATGAGMMIVGIDPQKRMEIQTLLARSFRESWTERQFAAQMKHVIGLTPKQALAIETQRATMLRNNVPEDQAAKMLDKKTGKIIRQRAVLIAAHERKLALNQAQRDHWLELQREHVLGPGAMWESVAKHGCGPRCAAQNGTLHNFSEQVAMPYHPNCRCEAVLRNTHQS